MATGSGTHQNGSGSSFLSAEFQTAVRAELELMLASPIFAQSNRCKNFLNYVVLQTLSGKASDLKERTIGICVFERSNDYDTGEDSIVRVTANEVRKRLGQFYRESLAAHPIQIELPRGAYVPEFRIHPDRRGAKAEEVIAPKPLDQIVAARQTPFTAEVHPFIVPPSTAARHPSQIAERTGPKKFRTARGLALAVALAVLVIGACAGGFQIWHIRARNDFPQLWDGFLKAKGPVLICFDAHDLRPVDAVSSPGSDTFFNDILHKQVISVDDAAVLASMAGLLGRKGITFRVAGAGETSLADLRRQPVILIGAVGNKWTTALTQDLPYRIDIAYPLGPNEPPIASIVGADQPANGPWRIDFSIPLSAWKTDYAIVARVDDDKTGVPVMIVAGLGNDGSLAASELISSDNLIAELKDSHPCSLKSDFEAVIGTEIIDREPGPPHILRLKCW